MSTFFKHWIVCVVLLLVCNGAWCNQYKVMTLEDKVKASDLVVIGRVENIRKDCGNMNSCAGIQISSLLKGKENPKEVFFVLFDGPIAEENPDCCVKGTAYLFFLKRLNGNIFISTNGPFGVYRLEGRYFPYLGWEFIGTAMLIMAVGTIIGFLIQNKRPEIGGSSN